MCPQTPHGLSHKCAPKLLTACPTKMVPNLGVSYGAPGSPHSSARPSPHPGSPASEPGHDFGVKVIHKCAEDDGNQSNSSKNPSRAPSPAQPCLSLMNSSVTCWAPPDLPKLLRSQVWFAWTAPMGRTGLEGTSGAALGWAGGVEGGIWDGNEDGSVTGLTANGAGTAWTQSGLS